MKLLTLLAVTTAIGGVCAAPAMAQNAPPAPAPAPTAEPEAPSASGFYAGAAISSLWLSKEYAASGLPVVFEDPIRLPGLSGRIGYTFNEYFAVEVDATIGLDATEYGTDQNNVLGEIRQKSSFGAHVVGTLPIAGDLYALGRVGFTSFEVERSFQGIDAEDLSDSGASFGLGLGHRFGALDARIEFNFLSAEGADGFFGLGIAQHF